MHVNDDTGGGDGVFYDLDAGSKRASGGRSLLAPRTNAHSRPQPPANSKSAAVGANAGGVLPRPKELFHPAALLQLDASDGDGDAAESEDENPFASLLQPPPPQIAERQPPTSPDASFSQPLTVSRRVSVEAAEARPTRWSQAASVGVKRPASRRKSVPTATLKTQAKRNARRASTMDTQQATSADEHESPSAPKKRSLADVLMRATLLSQQKSQDERSVSELHTSDQSIAVENDDAIADTEHQMREEKFEMQFFSPSKPNHTGARRKQKPDAAATRIRGDLGEAVARAIRKTTRDLTMLHSHGQTLLEENRDVPGFENAGLERVQDREYTVVCLRRQRWRPEGADADEQTVFDGHIQALSPTASPSPCPVKTRVRIVFSSQAATHLSLRPSALVKIYAPYHFVPLEYPVGSSTVRNKTRWLLVGTTLSEMVA